MSSRENQFFESVKVETSTQNYHQKVAQSQGNKVVQRYSAKFHSRGCEVEILKVGVRAFLRSS